MNTKRSERGQAIVLIVIALVALFGFAGLAVDGGRVYSEQRRAQSAADAAAYAAALTVVEGGSAYDEAIQQAKLNGFEDSSAVDVVVNNPPTMGVYAGDPEYFEVIIREVVPGTFIRVIKLYEVPVEGYAVVRSKDIKASSGENALHALKDTGVGIDILGNIDITVRKGDIFSNSGIDKSGTSGAVEAIGGDILAAGGWSGHSNVSPAPITGVPHQYVEAIPQPVCPAAPGTYSGNVLTPGVFASEIRISGGDNTMQPGMYCLKNGLQINGNAKLTGKGILIVLLGGEIRMNGSGDVILTRPNSIKDANGNEFGGMLVYVPPTNSNKVYMTGGNGTVFAGTIYAPSSNCEFGGESDALSLKANIVCDTISLNGNPHVDITYNPKQNYQLPPMLELSQ